MDTIRNLLSYFLMACAIAVVVVVAYFSIKIDLDLCKKHLPEMNEWECLFSRKTFIIPRGK